MAETPTPDERREPDHPRPEHEPEQPPDAEPGAARLDGIVKYLRPQVEDPLEGTVLDELIDDPLPPPGQRAKLPPKTRIVLHAARDLRVLGMSPDAIRQLRDDLRAARESLGRWLEISAENDASWAYRLVDQELAVFENQVRDMERIVESAGYRWNWDTAVMEIPPGASGGRPRQLLRDLVRALLLHFGVTKNTTKVREGITSELAPFFSSGLLDTSKGSSLYNAVDHSLRGK